MATPQRFEGSSIEEVLGRVRAELGTDAEIVEANKVRSGGIGGFFSKERFEVLANPVPGAGAARPAAPARALTPGRTVGPVLGGRPAPSGSSAAPSAPTAATPAGAASQAPLSLLDIADRVSAAESAADTTAPLPQLGEAPATKPRSRAQQVAEQVMAEHLRRMGGESPDTPDHATFQPFQPAEMPRISTEGSAFTEVLQRIASDAGHEIAQAVQPPPVVTPRPALAPSPGQILTATMSAQPTRAPAPATASPSTVAPGRMEGTQHAVAHAAAVTEPAKPADTVLALDVTTEHAEASAAVVAEEAPDSLPVPRPAAVEPTQSRTERLLSWLELDHLPRTTLMSALRNLPQMEALPETTGVVVAVVGERGRALRLCRQLARACDSDPREVVLASATYRGSAIPEEQRIIDITDATRDRRGWRRRSAPTFVAVECSPSLDAETQSWTRGVVEALDAHQVIGVVQAARKAEDVRAWADVIGGVDGLALEELTETTTPYAVLALEIPVAYLGDQPATPSSWAHLLLERTAA